MKRLFKTLAFAFLMTGVSFAQDVSGDWNGTLHVNGGELRLILHITKDTDGRLKATIDSIDQGTNGIPVNSVTLKDSRLNLKIDAINGSYDGVVKGNGSEIDGTWSQGQSFELAFHRGKIAVTVAAKAAKPSEIDGDWMGSLDTGMIKLRLVLHIINTEGGLTATMDSLDQGEKVFR